MERTLLIKGYNSETGEPVVCEVDRPEASMATSTDTVLFTVKEKKLGALTIGLTSAGTKRQGEVFGAVRAVRRSLRGAGDIIELGSGIEGVVYKAGDQIAIKYMKTNGMYGWPVYYSARRIEALRQADLSDKVLAPLILGYATWESPRGGVESYLIMEQIIGETADREMQMSERDKSKEEAQAQFDIWVQGISREAEEKIAWIGQPPIHDPNPANFMKDGSGNRWILDQ